MIQTLSLTVPFSKARRITFLVEACNHPTMPIRLAIVDKDDLLGKVIATYHAGSEASHG